MDKLMGMETSSRILVLIPCYMEAGYIGEIVAEVKKMNFPVVVVDDGSADNTAQEAKAGGAAVIRHEANKGKGAAIITGIAYAVENDYDLIITLDGDKQHNPNEIDRFVKKYNEEKPHLIIGSRMNNTKDMPIIRRIINRLMSSLISKIAGQKISDTQSGYRLISKDAMPVVMECCSSGFSAESEIILNLAYRGFNICEVPISTIYTNGKSKIRPVRDTLKFIQMLSHFFRTRRREDKGKEYNNAIP